MSTPWLLSVSLSALGASTSSTLGPAPAPAPVQVSCFGTCNPVAPPCTPYEFHYQWGGTTRGATFRKVGTAEHLWTAEDGGRIRHSSDGGNTWSEQESPREVHEQLQSLFFLDDGLTGWGVSEEGYVIGTLDGGGCWKVLANLAAELWDVHFTSATQGWVAGKGVLMSTVDGGCTWNPEPITLPAGMTMADVELYALDFVKRGTSFTGVTSGEPGLIFRRTQSTGWSVVVRLDSSNPANNIPPTLVTPNCCAAPCGDPVEIWDIEFAPTTDLANAAVYASAGLGNGCGTIFHGTLGGTVWTQELHQCNGGLPCPPSTTTCLNSSGCTTVHGYNNFTSLYSIHVIDAKNAVAVGYGAQVVKRDPATQTWTDLSDRCAFGTQPLYHVMGDRGSPQKVWSVGAFGALRRSLDGGVTWTELAGHGTWRLQEIAFANASDGWAVGQFFRIIHSSDGGATWCLQRQSACLGSAANLNAIAAGDASNLVAVGAVDPATNKGMILQTTNGGGGACPTLVSGWAPPASITCNPASCAALDGLALNDVTCSGNNGTTNEFWAVGNGGLVLRSTDGGLNWTQIPLVVGGVTRTDDLEGAAFLSTSRGVVVGSSGGLGKAYAVVTGGGTPVWVEITPLTGSAPLHEVSQNGGASITAVGDPASATLGTVLRYDVPTSRFVHDTTAEALCGDVSLTAVAAVPGTAGEVFVGGDEGFLLWSSNGVSWCIADSECGNAIRGLSFIGPNAGWSSAFGGGGSVIMNYRP